MPAIPTNLSPEGHDDQAITAVKINKILSERLPALVGGKIPVESSASLSISGFSTETTLSSVNGKLPSLSSGRIPTESNLRDGSGNSITSTIDGSKRRLDVTLSSAGTTGATAPTIANLYGGTDGTSLRPLSVDTSGVTNVNTRPRNSTVTRTASTTSSTANSSAQVLASDANRRYLLFQNISDTDMYLNFGAAATTDNLLISRNGGSIVFESGFVPTDQVNVICSGISKKYFALSA